MLAVELYPARLRATGAGFSNGPARLGAVAVAFEGGALLTRQATTAWAFLVMVLVVLAIAALAIASSTPTCRKIEAGFCPRRPVRATIRPKIFFLRISPADVRFKGSCCEYRHSTTSAVWRAAVLPADLQDKESDRSNVRGTDITALLIELDRT